MLDFTEQEVSVTSPPESSVDTQTVSDNRLEVDTLADPDTTAATLAALAPWLDSPHVFVQEHEQSIDCD